MEIFRFIKWQWNRFSTDEKMLSLMIVCGLGTIPGTLYLGFTLLFSILVGSLVSIGIGCLLAIFFKLVRQWNTYKLDKEKDAQMIINKLRGGRIGTGTNC